MKAVDFEYDGILLSNKGYTICEFDYSSKKVVSAGSDLTFNKVKYGNGRKNGLSSTAYEECYTATFDICKNPEFNNQEEMVISSAEFRELMRWLNRKEFLRLRFYYDDIEEDISARYFDASFNIEKIFISEMLYGIRLTLETNRPFAYGDERAIEIEFVGVNESYKFIDLSDEIGFIRPDIKIVCHSSGTLELSNDLTATNMTIKNCSDGEVISVLGSQMIIRSSDTNHNIHRDFNYDFFKIGNSFDNRVNVMSCSIPCSVSIKYTPIIKTGI